MSIQDQVYRDEDFAYRSNSIPFIQDDNEVLFVSSGYQIPESALDEEILTQNDFLAFIHTHLAKAFLFLHSEPGSSFNFDEIGELLTNLSKDWYDSYSQSPAFANRLREDAYISYCNWRIKQILFHFYSAKEIRDILEVLSQDQGFVFNGFEFVRDRSANAAIYTFATPTHPKTISSVIASYLDGASIFDGKKFFYLEDGSVFLDGDEERHIVSVENQKIFTIYFS